MYQLTANAIFNLVGNEYIYFDTEVKVKVSPHTPAFYAWAVCVSPTGGLYVMDSEQEWYYVEQSDRNTVNSLYQRIKLIESRYIGETVNEPQAA